MHIDVSTLLQLRIAIGQIEEQRQQQKEEQNNEKPITTSSCISYDATKQVITITCGSANLSDIYKQINDVNILQKEQESGNDDTSTTSNSNNNNSKVWLLNAGIVIGKGANLIH